MNQSIIWNKTFELLLESRRSFYSLTVFTLCKAIGIHRSTFYRHFDSKYDLLEYGVNTLWQDYFESMTHDFLFNPFTFSQEFFLNSDAKDLIESQKDYSEVLEDIQNITLSRLEKYYKERLTDPTGLHSGFIISTLIYLDNWNTSQKQSVKTLDKLFNELCASSLKKL